ncbi:unnamed protein product [Polarella glacialis]|uniref:Uncharacterized protein n=1 Tax=Polarella glacialis TaxID=89957 RepID=A0A813ELF9_POLGL|nr:unnamed protein product [Polarella glacialis]
MDHSTSVPTLGFGGNGRSLFGGPTSPLSAASPSTGSSSACSMASFSLSGGNKPSCGEATPARTRQRARPVTMVDIRSNSPEVRNLEDQLQGESKRSSSRSPVRCSRTRSLTEDAGLSSPVRRRPLGLADRKPGSLKLSGSLLSMKSFSSDHHLGSPESPMPGRDDHRSPNGGVAVVFFDFDGTLTATPGEKAARGRKQAELCDRASMLAPRLRAMRADGASLGIVSKSSEATIRAALEASGLAKLFDGPVVAKAIGFEGKTGFVEDLALRGCLPRLGSYRGHAAPLHRILLVDDDVLELQRAKARGLQTYAAPAEGGLRDEDFDVIMEALKMPRPKSHPQQIPCRAAPNKQCTLLMPLQQRSPSSAPSLGSSPVRPWRHKFSDDSSPLKLPPFHDLGRPMPAGRWKNLIVFSGDCFQG